jgi:arylsulfatase A-like enzyme
MTDVGQTAAPGGRARRIVRIASIGLLAVGLATYLMDFAASYRGGLPLRPLEIPEEFSLVESLPMEPGDLAGRSVVLITLDTTRADRLGIYGNPGAETAHFDRLAREGAIFSRAVATGPSTLPTHASIMTGLYPSRHGARANSVFSLAEEQRTLAEILAEAGYETAAFPSAFVLDARFGLDQGFDVYDASTRDKSLFHFAERSATDTTDRAIRWLQAGRRKPVFIWVHYYDPHATYDPPEPFASRLHPYDGEIAYADREMGRLLEAVDEVAGSRSLVIATADHGESLGDHGEYTHGYMLQETTQQIPLVMRARGALPGGLHLDRRASQVDLMPTILSLLGIDVPAGLDGVDLLRPPDPERAVMAETLEGRVTFGWARLSALYRGRLKLVAGPRSMLYDLADDPLEGRDLAATRREDTFRMERALGRLRGNDGQRLATDTGGLDRTETARLEALGYVVADEAFLDAGGAGADPRDWAELVSEVQRIALTQSKVGFWRRVMGRISGHPLPSDREDAMRMLEAIAAENPDFTPVYFYLRRFYREQHRHEDVARVTERIEALKKGASGAGSSP